MRKWILSLLLGGDAKSWKEMFRIAVECNESCNKVLERQKYLIERYSAIVDRENAILKAVSNSSDWQLKAKVIEILNSDAKMDGGGENASN